MQGKSKRILEITLDMFAIYLSRFYCYLDFDVFILAVFQFLYIRFNLSFLSLTTAQPLQRHFLTLIKEIHHRAIQSEKKGLDIECNMYYY